MGKEEELLLLLKQGGVGLDSINGRASSLSIVGLDIFCNLGKNPLEALWLMWLLLVRAVVAMAAAVAAALCEALLVDDDGVAFAFALLAL